MGKFVIQVLAGAVGAVTFLFSGIAIAYSTSDYDCVSLTRPGHSTEHCHPWDARIVLVLMITAMVTPVAGLVSITGRLMKVRGSFWLALAGAVPGAVIVLISSSLIPNLRIYIPEPWVTISLLGLTSIGAAIGYNLPNWISSRSQRSNGE